MKTGSHSASSRSEEGYSALHSALRVPLPGGGCSLATHRAWEVPGFLPRLSSACWEMLCRHSHNVPAASRAQQRWRKEQRFLKRAHLSESGAEKNSCLGGGGLAAGPVHNHAWPLPAGPNHQALSCSALTVPLPTRHFSSARPASAHFNTQ